MPRLWMLFTSEFLLSHDSGWERHRATAALAGTRPPTCFPGSFLSRHPGARRRLHSVTQMCTNTMRGACMVLAGPTAAAGPSGRAVRSGGKAPCSGAALLPFRSAGLAASPWELAVVQVAVRRQPSGFVITSPFPCLAEQHWQNRSSTACTVAMWVRLRLPIHLLHVRSPCPSPRVRGQPHCASCPSPPKG